MAFQEHKKHDANSNYDVSCAQARRQLEMEKGKLKEMEKRHKDNQQKCDMYSSLDDGSHGSEMDRMLKQESDALEIQKKLLDDLEFHLLEVRRPDSFVIYMLHITECILYKTASQKPNRDSYRSGNTSRSRA